LTALEFINSSFSAILRIIPSQSEQVSTVYFYHASSETDKPGKLADEKGLTAVIGRPTVSSSI